MAEKKYKYQIEDFPPLPVGLDHLQIHLNILDGEVEAVNCLSMTARQDVSEITLDANSLEIRAVEAIESFQDENGAPLEFEYAEEANRLTVSLGRMVPAGENFIIRTKTICHPTDQVLEGIYLDTTPPDAPPQYISQCQQWGFQRIMPIFDDCRAKCTMTTTIEGDARYTHLISNGDVCLATNPDGVPIPKPGQASRQIITYENKVPMAPYLFFVGAGTWDEVSDEVKYPSGRSFAVKYLVPKGQAEYAKLPLAVTKDAIYWINQTQGYEYPGDTYRTICMDRSNWGGMENVGNTTIITEAALVDEFSLDEKLIYTHAVIAHEFYHNQCGSETTMATPFDMWLNEAYTVHIERRYTESKFDPAMVRLRQLDSMRDPLAGPLAIEDGGHQGRIAREGFNDPDEVVDGVTYVKAAEVVRSLELYLGAKAFEKAKDLYFSRYHNSNADTDQFFACFEEASGRNLAAFRAAWLHTIGYPKVKANTSYDESAGSYEIKFSQHKPEGSPVFICPVELALVDEKGNDIPDTGKTFILDKDEATLKIEGLKQKPAFASLNRDCSFYGSFEHENASIEELAAQAEKDPNHLNRVEAMRRLTDRQRVRLLNDPEAKVDSLWLDLYGKILTDKNLPPALKAYLLRIDEQPLDRAYATWFLELVAARDRLLTEINQAHRQQLVLGFTSISTYGAQPTPMDGLEERLLKGVLLGVLAHEDSLQTQSLILEHLRAACNPTDQLNGLILLNRSRAPERLEVLEQAYRNWHGRLTGYANYLRAVSSGTRPDVFEQIEKEKKRRGYDIKHPTLSRWLFLPMAANTRMVWSQKGIDWLTASIIELAHLKRPLAYTMLGVMRHVKNLKEPLKQMVTPALEQIAAKVPESVSPMVHNQARAFLEGVE